MVKAVFGSSERGLVALIEIWWKVDGLDQNGVKVGISKMTRIIREEQRRITLGWQTYR